MEVYAGDADSIFPIRSFSIRSFSLFVRIHNTYDA